MVAKSMGFGQETFHAAQQKARQDTGADQR